MIGNLNEISLFTQAYFTMLTTIHESKNYPLGTHYEPLYELEVEMVTGNFQPFGVLTWDDSL